jgi:hypothetical protein
MTATNKYHSLNIKKTEWSKIITVVSPVYCMS